MSIQPYAKLSPQEYLALERQNEYKSEYFNGEMFAMAGANKRHNQLVVNISSELRAQLKERNCNVYTVDMRVQVSRTGLYTYPDIVAVSGEEHFKDDEEDTLLNPTVVFEVLSKSTAHYDRGDKFLHYRKIESLQEYFLISQTAPLIEHYVRQTDSLFWTFSEASDLQTEIELPSINCRLALAEVYAKVNFPQTSR